MRLCWAFPEFELLLTFWWVVLTGMQLLARTLGAQAEPIPAHTFGQRDSQGTCDAANISCCCGLSDSCCSCCCIALGERLADGRRVAVGALIGQHDPVFGACVRSKKAVAKVITISGAKNASSLQGALAATVLQHMASAYLCGGDGCWPGILSRRRAPTAAAEGSWQPGETWRCLICGLSVMCGKTGC
jgi:hypothetical protein